MRNTSLYAINAQSESITYPAHVSVIESMHPCPCGFFSGIREGRGSTK
ncbi:ATP-binding protein [Desulfosporosinus sp. I2]|nr:ATP-binding protein [Desulfosporosinus sp. I2]